MLNSKLKALVEETSNFSVAVSKLESSLNRLDKQVDVIRASAVINSLRILANLINTGQHCVAVGLLDSLRNQNIVDDIMFELERNTNKEQFENFKELLNSVDSCV